MQLIKLHDPADGQMRVVGLMSGSGSNLRKILEAEKQFDVEKGQSPFTMVAIFSDSYDSNAPEIGKDFDLPVVIRDKKGFYAAREKSLRDLVVRAEFDRENVRALEPFEATVAAYGGYMSIATAPLMDAFLGVNVHPADLSIMDGGWRKYTGDNAVLDAILGGEPELRSSTHIIEPEVDGGRLLMVSRPLKVVLPRGFASFAGPEVANGHQERLKKVGDWDIFPKTLQYLAEGRYSKDSEGSLYFDGDSIPEGVRLE